MGRELRTTALPLKMCRKSIVDTTMWKLNASQPFFPSLESLFSTTAIPNISSYGIRLDEEIESVVSESTIRTTKGNTVSIHRKTTMLLSPLKTMRGE